MFSKKLENGFTLIEQMIVIAIIGILAAIAIPQYFANVETAKTQTVAGNLKMAVDAVSNAFAASNNKVSTDIYNTLNGQSAHDAATISRAGPQKVSIMVSTTGCTGNLGTEIASACSAEGFIHAATTTGVIITKNGNVTP